MPIPELIAKTTPFNNEMAFWFLLFNNNKLTTTKLTYNNNNYKPERKEYFLIRNKHEKGRAIPKPPLHKPKPIHTHTYTKKKKKTLNVGTFAVH